MAAHISSCRFSVAFKIVTDAITSNSRVRFIPNDKRVTYLSTQKISQPKLNVSTKTSKLDLHPKVVVHNFYQSVVSQFRDQSLYPEAKIEPLTGKCKSGINRWKTTVHLKWPQSLTTEAVGKRKSESEAKAYAKIMEILKELKVLSPQNEPRLNNRDEIIKFLDDQRAPFLIKLDGEIENRISNLLNRFEDIKDELSMESTQKRRDAEKVPVNAITGQPYGVIDKAELSRRNTELHLKWQLLQSSNENKLLEIKNIQRNLPIYNYQQQILELIDRNQVIVLSGETGCGKSTQIPQYVLNYFSQMMQGSHCNMIVTQPRRISAISIADRVAKERNEQLGETIGFQVRLSSKIPKKSGAILFCSSGILLRRLQTNPYLEGISHVIIDEAHERDIITDFLLVLLKAMIQRGSPLKVILMSASMNEENLAKYFNDCPIIRIPGRVYPVTDYYLDEIIQMTKDITNYVTPTPSSFTNPLELDFDFIAHVVASIDSSRPPGAILCFLPGWQEIQNVQTRLGRLLPNCNTHAIFAVHSRVPQQDQSLIFGETPPGTRKIVLATNIAETSITIGDVVYVVDSGRVKENSFDPDWGTTTLRTKWITKANVTQRKGRAGRVSSGECFHLYPKEFISQMDAFPLPEIQRSSLEKVVLDAKVYCCENDSVEDFLSRCPEPPRRETTRQAISELIKRGFLNHDETLTPLGRCASTFSTHPYISKSLIYSTWLKCVQPVLSISAFLTGGKDVFLKTNENKSVIRQIKEKFADGTLSDHISLANLFDSWENAALDGGYVAKKEFSNENLIHWKNTEYIRGLRSILTDHLIEVGLLDTAKDLNKMNSSGVHWPTVLASLCAGFEPNFVRCLRGEVTRKKINKTAVTYRESAARVMITSDSLNYVKKCSSDKIPFWLVYFYKTCSADSGLTVIRDSSPAPPFAVLLFSGRKINIADVNSGDSKISLFNICDPVILSVDGSKLNTFCCSKKQAFLLRQLRVVIDSIFSAHLARREVLSLVDPLEINKIEIELMDILKKLFEIEAVSQKI